MQENFVDGRGCPKCRFAIRGCGRCRSKPYLYLKGGERLTQERKTELRAEAMARLSNAKRQRPKPRPEPSPMPKPRPESEHARKTENTYTVYIISNSYLPGVVKVGKSIDLNSRLGVLNTSLPEDFIVCGKISFDTRQNMDKAERLAHEFLKYRRVNPRKEFFKCTPEEAIHVVNLIKDLLT